MPSPKELVAAAEDRFETRLKAVERELLEGAGQKPAGDFSSPNFLPIDPSGAIGAVVFRSEMPINITDPPYEASPFASPEFNTAAIIAALNAGAEEGRAVYAPAGIYEIEEVTYPSNTEFFGDGWRTEFVIAPEVTKPYGFRNLDFINGNINCALHDFALNGNKALAGEAPSAQIICTSEDGFFSQNIVVNRIWSKNAHSLGIVFVNATIWGAKNNLCTDHDRDGITAYFECKQFFIAGNQILRCNDDGVGLNAENGETGPHAMEDFSIVSNQIIGQAAKPGSYGAITFNGTRAGEIIGNLVDGVKQRGIVGFDTNETPVGDMLVASNVLQSVGAGGEGFRPAMGIYQGLLGISAVRDVNIVGNVIRQAAREGIYLQNDNEEQALEQINISNNLIDRAGQSGIPGHGIHVNDSLIDSVSITNNICHDCSGDGIRAITFGERLFNIMVQGNACYNNVLYGVRILGVTSGTLIGNTGYNTYGFQQAGVSARQLIGRWVFKANHAYNNTGAQWDYAENEEAEFWDSMHGAVPTQMLEITGSRGGNAALKNLLIQGEIKGMWIDGTVV